MPSSASCLQYHFGGVIVANHKSAIKRHKQSEVRNARNRASKTRIHNVVKAVRTAIASGDANKAQELLSQATSVISKAAGKAIHWRNAARKVSRLTRAVNAAKQAE